MGARFLTPGTPTFESGTRTDLPISRLGDLYVRHRWQPERGPANLYA
jgi:hypothetical protein